MTPDWAIKANGKDATSAFRPYLLEIRVRDESKDEADSLTIVLDNSDAALQPPEQGDELEVLLGYRNDLRSLGRFIVDSVTFDGPPDRVTIACKAAAFAEQGDAESAAGNPEGLGLQSWLVRKSRSWEAGTLEVIAKKVAAEHGVDLVANAGVLALTLPHIDQTDESDTELLYRILKPRGYLLKVADKKLVLLPRSGGDNKNPKTQQTVPTVVIRRTEVSTYSGRWAERGVYDKAVAYWHNVSTGQPVYVTAGTGNKVFRFKHPAPDEATAQKWAKSMVKESKGEAGHMAISMPGRVDIQSEQRLRLEGFTYPLSASPSKDAVAKEWVVKSVEHSLTRGGFTTSVQGEPFIQET